jgi:membrane-associated protease RseP (regulator of RpoE activity)
LDGGHITFTLIGDAARLLYWPAIAALIGIGLLTGNALQWGIWAALLLLMRNRHAQPLDNVTRLDPARKMIAVICLLLFILVFVPIPLTIVP